MRNGKNFIQNSSLLLNAIKVGTRIRKKKIKTDVIQKKKTISKEHEQEQKKAKIIIRNNITN